MPKPQIHAKVGDVLQLKKAAVVVGEGIAELETPPGRYMAVLVLGVAYKGQLFDVEPMLRALGYVPEKLLYQMADGGPKEAQDGD